MKIGVMYEMVGIVYEFFRKDDVYISFGFSSEILSGVYSLLYIGRIVIRYQF